MKRIAVLAASVIVLLVLSFSGITPANSSQMQAPPTNTKHPTLPPTNTQRVPATLAQSLTPAKPPTKTTASKLNRPGLLTMRTAIQ